MKIPRCSVTLILVIVAVAAAFLGGYRVGRRAEALDLERRTKEAAIQAQAEQVRLLTERLRKELSRVGSIRKVVSMETDYVSRDAPGNNTKLQVLLEPDASETMATSEARFLVSGFLRGLDPEQVEVTYKRARATWKDTTPPPPGTGFERWLGMEESLKRKNILP
ncbi:MAG: hypothetical protein AAGG44_09330 [Planctomycetota bacterium]